MLLKLVGVVVVVSVGSYYYLTEVSSDWLIVSYCRRMAQEKGLKKYEEAVRVRDRFSEALLFEECYEDIKDFTIWQTLVSFAGLDSEKVETK